jgi:pimeloyl-ACP methyl ester carboxylesterase
MGELRRPGGVLRYVDEGSGPAVVCVHGNPTWSYHFRNLVRALADDHRVVAPDHLGMGRSDVPAPRRYGYDLAARVDDFGALMDHLRIGRDAPATLVVHDWGGAIALTWAVRHPERVGRLVVTNTAAFPLLPGHRVPPLLWPARLPVLGEALVCGANAFVRATLRLGVRRRRLAPEVRRAYRSPYRTWRERTGVLRFVRDVPAGPGGRTHALLAETAANLHRLADRPAQIVWGLRDPVLTPAYLDEWRRRLPDAEIHALDDAGHLVLEDAAEAVPLIAAFLARTSATVTAVS